VTTLDWSSNGTTITSHSIQDVDGVAGDGWVVAWDYTSTISGCNGCSYVEAEGNAAFVWEADDSYQNFNQNYVTGYADGAATCSIHWQWNLGFPGWHTQTWCQS
jgi:hypothetical protein